MMNFKLLRMAPFALSLLFMGCKNEGESGRFRGFNKLINVNSINNVPNNVNTRLLDITIPIEHSLMFDYNKSLTDLSFIKLETTPVSKIGKIDKIYITNKRIIVIDFYITRAVFIFDSTGRFINKISTNQNYAGNNLSNFLDAAYNFTTDEVVLHDDVEGKLFYFDINGNFERTVKEYISFINFSNIKNTDNFVYLNLFGNNKHISELTKANLYIGKKNTEIQFTAPNARTSNTLNIKYTYRTNLSSCNTNNKLFYTPIFSDTIYQVDGNPVNVYPKLALHFPKPDLNTEIRKNKQLKMNGIIELMNSFLYYYFNGQVLNTDDSLYFLECSKNGSSGYFYSERTNKIIGGDIIFELNTKDSTQIDSYEYPQATFNNYFVSILPASAFSNKSKLPTLKLSSIKKNTKPTDNPVLIFYKLKDF